MFFVDILGRSQNCTDVVLMHTDAPVGHARTLDTFSFFIVSILLCHSDSPTLLCCCWNRYLDVTTVWDGDPIPRFQGFFSIRSRLEDQSKFVDSLKRFAHNLSQSLPARILEKPIYDFPAFTNATATCECDISTHTIRPGRRNTVGHSTVWYRDTSTKLGFINMGVIWSKPYLYYYYWPLFILAWVPPPTLPPLAGLPPGF